MTAASNCMNSDVVAAPLAILDGTHLCLLPLINHTATYETENVIMESDAFSVPAISLSKVHEFCGKEFMSCTTVDEDALCYLEDDYEEGSDASVDGCFSSSIEVFQLNVSDLSNSEYVITYPVSAVLSERSPMPIRIFCDQIDDATIAWSNDRNNVQFLEVLLPSLVTTWTNDFRRCGCFRCGNLLERTEHTSNTNYFPEHYNYLDQAAKPPHYFEVKNAGFCLVADFFGVAGYQQALIIPQLDKTMIPAPAYKLSGYDVSIQWRKNLLMKILLNSLITDGIGTLLSGQLRQKISRVQTEQSIEVRLPMILMDSNSFESTLKSEKYRSRGASMSPTLSVIEPLSKHGSNLEDKDGLRHSLKTSGQNNADEENDSSSTPSMWLRNIEKTVEWRLAQDADEERHFVKTTEMCDELISVGKRTLHRATCSNLDDSLALNSNTSSEVDQSEPEIVRLRYGIRPRTSEDMRGVAVALDLELDIFLPRNELSDTQHLSSIAKSNDGLNASNKSSAISNVLNDFHVSCLITDKVPNLSNCNAKITCKNIRTISGVVPTLSITDCFTILASVYLNDVETILHNNSSSSSIDVGIQGIWIDDSPRDNQTSYTPLLKRKRHGKLLCIIRLTEDMLLLSSLNSSNSTSGLCIQHQINFFSPHHDSEKYIPSAIFEYRQPCIMVIDVSHERNLLQVEQVWNDILSHLNPRIGQASFIDLCWMKEEPRLKLLIFGSNLDERVATVKLLLRYIPKSTKLFIEDPYEKENVSALLKSVKLEAEALKKHRLLSLKGLNEAHKEMVSLQCSTDGIASLLKRGWR